MSYSQIGQDLWVLKCLNYKKNGFFVEAGACDGLLLSNTLLLENNYNWSGICAEPHPVFFSNLQKNRNCHKSNLCLFSESNLEMNFSAADQGVGGLDGFFNEPERQEYRDAAEKVIVKTITLNDLLDKFNSPKNIDYISLDTEGTELDIIKCFDFNKYNVKLWTIEHNSEYRADKEDYLKAIIELMISKNYEHYIVQHDVWFKKRNE